MYQCKERGCKTIVGNWFQLNWKDTPSFHHPDIWILSGRNCHEYISHVRQTYYFLTIVFSSWLESKKIPSKEKSLIQPIYSSSCSLYSIIGSLPLVKNSLFPHSKKHLSALAVEDGLQFILAPVSKGNCLCCGSCGHPLDVQRALGQPVARRDGLPQTSLSCQLTLFPRVPQCQRSSESVSANTWGEEAGKMFRFVPDSQTRAAKQWFSGTESNCVWF